MNLISEKTIEDFEAWAKENEDKSIFSKIHKEGDSYYTNRNPEETYLTEYSFGNMAELKQSLEVYSGLSADSHILTKLIVEICKNRNSRKVKISADENNLLQKEKISAKMLIKSSAKVCGSLLSENVIEEFFAWAKENKDNNIFSEISEEEDSYYINRNSEETYLMEYSFQNMAWLKEALEECSGLSADSQMLKNMTVEICQKKFESNPEIREHLVSEKKEEKVQESKKTLPEFVYVF